jgi:hypothetical protein
MADKSKLAGAKVLTRIPVISFSTCEHDEETNDAARLPLGHW